MESTCRHLGEIIERFSLFFSLLSIKYIEDFTQHFLNIFQYLCFVGKNLFQEKIPIIPSQHYTMDGIDVDLDGKTSLSHLFRWEKLPVWKCMEKMDWQVILFWRVSFLEKEQLGFCLKKLLGFVIMKK